MARRGELVRVGSLFEKYKKTIIAPQASVIQVVVEVVSDVCDITLKTSQVKYQVASRTVIIQAPAILKHEILRHSEDVLNHCRGRLGVKNSPKVIL